MKEAAALWLTAHSCPQGHVSTGKNIPCIVVNDNCLYQPSSPTGALHNRIYIFSFHGIWVLVHKLGRNGNAPKTLQPTHNLLAVKLSPCAHLLGGRCYVCCTVCLRYGMCSRSGKKL